MRADACRADCMATRTLSLGKFGSLDHVLGACRRQGSGNQQDCGHS